MLPLLYKLRFVSFFNKRNDEMMISKMPNEGIDVVSWFVGVDKLFEQLSVPADLQAILIRPYLSDRAKLLMSKCDPTHSAKYENIKSLLLKELHVSSSISGEI